MTSKIEWTDETWNPLTGCAAVSPGCDNCYAAREAAGRLKGHAAYAGLAVRPEGSPAEFTGEIRLHPDRLDQPLRWRRPRRVFVNSMSDLFHPDVPAEFVERVWDVMADTVHQYQVLTKRPQRMREFMAEIIADAGGHVGMYGCTVPLHNVWLGTSIESDRYTFRADHLRATPAAVRFLSLEPLLGPLPSLDLTGIDWVIVGGESGPGARPMHPDWVRDIRDRCVAADVPFFFKQHGEWSPDPESKPDPDAMVLLDGRVSFPGDEVWFAETIGAAPMAKVGKRAAGRQLDGRTWDEMPEVGR